MIDMVNFKDFEMDSTTWQATFGAGYKLGELDEQLHKNGKRAMAHGTCPDVGVGGHATIVSIFSGTLPSCLHFHNRAALDHPPGCGEQRSIMSSKSKL